MLVRAKLAVSSEAINAERKFLAVPIGSALNFDQFAAKKLCKNDVEVVENFGGVQVSLYNKFWTLRVQIIPSTEL